MRRIFITLICWTALVASLANAGTFPLTDGTKIVGSPESINDNGVVFQLDGGDYSPRLGWDKFTPEALKELKAEAKKESERALLEPMVDNLPQEVAKRKEIVVKPIQPPDRPKQGSGIFALFGSPVGWMIMLVLYGGNLFAAYEVCIYRHLPAARVCGLAAIPFFGVLSPIIYGAMPTQVPPPETFEAAPAQEPAPATPEVAPAPGTPAPAASYAPSATGARTQEAAPPAAAPAPTLPEPVVFARGEFSFNRRFFETKFAGFFRVIPSEAEKDLVLVFKAARGQFVGRRISRITPSELALEIVKNNVSAEEVIPFVEIAEVQIRHKDTV
ncbi:MAG TPA: hypothetical protein VGR14_03685 [Verrucomicrobiae bacterium]|jgi:hypothetical protein|nr:hypothetical protein [Verrucomicrobiae bacterium]